MEPMPSVQERGANARLLTPPVRRHINRVAARSTRDYVLGYSAITLVIGLVVGFLVGLKF